MPKPEIVKNKPNLTQIAAHLDGKGDINAMLDAGATVDDITVALKFRAERDNKAAQSKLKPPAKMADADWQERRAWILDGQPIHGSGNMGALQEYYLQALDALKADDQVGYSRARDLLFKAVRTQLGDDRPPQPPVGEVAVPMDAQAQQ